MRGGFRRSTLLLVIAAATLILAGCTLPFVSTSSVDQCTPQPLGSRLAPVEGIYVLPDDGRRPLLDEIERSQCSIDVTSYLISDDDIIEALGRADARGVVVRVIYEETPFGGFGGVVDTAEELARYGVQVRPGGPEFRFTHAKYIIIDDQVGIITNQNLTFSAFEQNREFGVITTKSTVVGALDDVFEADWSGSAAPAPPLSLLVSPKYARASLIGAIDRAETDVRLYAEVVRDGEVISALEHAVARGVAVRLVINEPDDDLDLEVYARLSSSGIEIRVADHLYIHAKAMIVDGNMVIVGSHNPTSTSIDNNREVSLIVNEPVSVERSEVIFERDWIRSVPWGV